jgi:hypothetical protein
MLYMLWSIRREGKVSIEAPERQRYAAEVPLLPLDIYKPSTSFLLVMAIITDPGPCSPDPRRPWSP